MDNIANELGSVIRIPRLLADWPDPLLVDARADLALRAWVRIVQRIGRFLELPPLARAYPPAQSTNPESCYYKYKCGTHRPPVQIVLKVESDYPGTAEVLVNTMWLLVQVDLPRDVVQDRFEALSDSAKEALRREIRADESQPISQQVMQTALMRTKGLRPFHKVEASVYSVLELFHRPDVDAHQKILVGDAAFSVIADAVSQAQELAPTVKGDLLRHLVLRLNRLCARFGDEGRSQRYERVSAHLRGGAGGQSDARWIADPIPEPGRIIVPK